MFAAKSKPHETSLVVALVLAMSALSFSEKPTASRSPQRIPVVGRGPQYLPNEVIIKFKSSTQLQLGKNAAGALVTGIALVDRALQKFQAEELRPVFPHHRRPITPDEVDLTRFYYFRYRDGSEPRKVTKILQSTGAIEYAEPHYIRYLCYTPNDPDYGRQWYLRKIRADSAWNVTKGDTSIVIGIVDTGVDWQHPDLAANIWQNNREIPNNGIDDDQNGYVDDIRGWDFGGLSGTADNNPDEDRSTGDHGTLLAGLASAVTDNSVGVAGIGFKCKIMPVKVSRNDSRDEFGNPFILYGYEGLVYAADNGASVINTSWGSLGYSQIEQEWINYATAKGALVVAAAGNGGSSEPIYPAGYAHVLAVAGTDSLDRRSVWGTQSSNYGIHISLSAPGSAIYGTWKPSTYQQWDGTSFSAPIVGGTAALVKGLHRSWTPDQIAQQIRVTADPIDNLNPGFSKQLGLGRVNVFRAVNDTSSPGLQMISFTISDSVGGNNDRSIDPGETIRISGQFRNYLRPTSNATAQLTTSDPLITVTNGTVSLGSIGTLQATTNASNPFVIQVSSSAAENHKATLYVNFSEGAYRDYTGFTVFINATYKDHNVNNITMTVTSKGTLAFNDYPDNMQGTGFVYHRGGEDNLLFEGAFMAGTDSGHVVDAARSDNQDFQSADFLTQSRFAFLQFPAHSDQEGTGAFNDGGAGLNQVGLQVSLNTYAFKDAPDGDYIILKYTLVNRKATPISNLRAGLYFDWDVGSYSQNMATYDSLRRLGYVFDTDPGGSRTFTGAALLTTGSAQFRAIDNNDQNPGNPWGVYDGFTKAEKWEALSGGTTHRREGPSDVSFVLGTGPLSIGGNDSIVVGFAVLAGTSDSILQSSAVAARQKWGVIVTDVEKASPQIPSTFFLYQNYPNPFNPTTTIHYDLPHETHVTLKLFNLLGQEVRTLVDEMQDAGFKSLSFNASGLSSGVYFYRIQAGAYNDIRKLVILR